ncbi:MAG: DNA mismatch repair endonuclease MutL, partial [Clostridia bacterium]|nr:DNA mismatch repair endonuclease MutL [Clostridia bacterium]
MKINILEPSVYNRIAAGEVVENPASAVKELVENSIDAGATKINVAIAQGGIKSIEVTDDGCGIEKEELYKTILPHATGKITTASDLDSIATLGFRGEALASIAAVSEIEIKSKYMSAECGAKLTAKGGENVTIDDIAYNQGTSILISNLFYNTPVRFKFLKSVRTEESYVTKIMFQLILANPHIAIKYEADGKQVYLSDGSGQENAIKTVFSADTSPNMLAMKEDFTQPIRVSGYISSPSLYKSNRNLQTFILNGRVV